MKKLITKFSIILFLTTVFSGWSYGQNKYLSFTEGKSNLQNQETLPVRDYLNMKTQGVQLEYRFSGAYIAEKLVDKTTYNFLHINGFAKMTQVGAPALPQHNEIIAIPKGSTGKIIILNSITAKNLLLYYITNSLIILLSYDYKNKKF